jgi:hypothetical protein
MENDILVEDGGRRTEDRPPAQPTLEERCRGMSAEQRYAKVKRMLKDRGMTIAELSRLATMSEKNWPHVSQVMRGIRPGIKTWKRLAQFLTLEELIVLGKGGMFHVERSKNDKSESDE